MRCVVLAAMLVLCASPSMAADLCKALALRDVPALESPQSIIPKGGYDDAIIQYRVNQGTGVASFCSHGGFCYPTHLLVGGRKIEALRLVNCKVNLAQLHMEGEEATYGVDVIRSAVPSVQLRESDVSDRLRQLGLCNACADNVAAFYVRQPSSRCASVARQALEGNPEAYRTLDNDPPYCRFWR